MYYTDLNYTDYFHKVLVFEVDNLTEDFKDIIKIEVDDCFIMCCNFISNTNELMFAVLGVGNDIENCTKGLKRKKPLKIYNAKQLINYPVFRIFPEFHVVVKSMEIINKYEKKSSEKLNELRSERALDRFRNPLKPDNLILISSEDGKKVDVELTNINDFIIEGYIKEEKTIIKAMPYYFLGQDRLITVVVKQDASKEELEKLDEFLKLLNDKVSLMKLDLLNDITKS